MDSRKLNIFHYGGFFPSDKTLEKNRKQLEKLDRVLKDINGISITQEPASTDNKFISEEKCGFLDKYDIVIIDDIAKNCRDYNGMKRFIELNILEKGKTLIFLGGYGLTKAYNTQLGKYLSASIKHRFPEDTHNDESKEVRTKLRKNIKISRGIGVGLNFSGFNILEPLKDSEVLSWFEADGEEYPAWVSCKVGEAKIIIFGSSSHPSWGTQALKNSEDFKKMWVEIFYYINLL